MCIFIRCTALDSRKSPVRSVRLDILQSAALRGSEAYISCNKQSLAPSWIKISISNGDRRLHAITKVFVLKEKNS